MDITLQAVVFTDEKLQHEGEHGLESVIAARRDQVQCITSDGAEKVIDRNVFATHYVTAEALVMWTPN